MKRISRLLSCSLVLMIGLSVSSFGWNNTGHMAVAFVAYQRLNPATKARMATLLRLNPDFNLWNSMIPATVDPATREEMLFMIAATWPDKIKQSQHVPRFTNDGDDPNVANSRRNVGYPDHLMHKYWHFVDTPFTQDNARLGRLPAPNAQTQIDAFRGVLSSTRPDPLKSYDLVWLLHIVGDVHQPLHATTRFSRTPPTDDHGGNSVKIRVCQNPGCPSELHAYWDGLLGNDDSLRGVVAIGGTLPQAPAASADNLTTSAWITESFEAGKANVYVNPIGLGGGPFPIAIGSNYDRNARALAKARVALAGARLANILNRELR